MQSEMWTLSVVSWRIRERVAESFQSPVFVSLFSHCSAETEADVLDVSLKPKHAETSAA